MPTLRSTTGKVLLCLMLVRIIYTSIETKEMLTITSLDHCLNDLVQNAQCRADTTPKFFEWETERIKPEIVPNYHIARTCVDLDYFKDSLKDRVVSHAEMRRLKNPLLNT